MEISEYKSPNCHQETHNFDEASIVDERDKVEHYDLDYKESVFEIVGQKQVQLRKSPPTPAILMRGIASVETLPSAKVSACDREGNQVEPTPKDWPEHLYICDRCGRIINQDTLEVAGIKHPAAEKRGAVRHFRSFFLQ